MEYEYQYKMKLLDNSKNNANIQTLYHPNQGYPINYYHMQIKNLETINPSIPNNFGNQAIYGSQTPYGNQMSNENQMTNGNQMPYVNQMSYPANSYYPMPPMNYSSMNSMDIPKKTTL